MFKLDTTKPGKYSVFKTYELDALYVLEKAAQHGGFLSTLDIWTMTNERLQTVGKEPVSRATIINYLKALDENGYLNTESATGKGGHRSLYRLPHVNLEKTFAEIIESFMKKINAAFPEISLDE